MFSDMTVNTSHDLLVFFSVFICGLIVGVVFDIFRALRKAHTPGTNFLAFQDALFCASAFWIFSYTVERYGDGDLRWFVFAAFFLALILYFLTIGKFVFPFFYKIFIIIKEAVFFAVRFLRKIISFVIKPFCGFFKKCKSVFIHKKTGHENGQKRALKAILSKKVSKKSLQAPKNSL